MAPDRDADKSAIRLKEQAFGYHGILLCEIISSVKIRKKDGVSNRYAIFAAINQIDFACNYC